MRNLKLCFAGLMLLGCQSAFADSDGYYCIGPDYLAVQTSLQDGFIQNAPPMGSSGHILSIYRPAQSESDVVDISEITLPSFQTHHMNCEPGKVEIYGFEKGYTVDLTSNSVEELADPDFDRSQALNSLRSSTEAGGQPHAKTLKLDGWSASRAYELHVFGYSVASPSSEFPYIHHHTVSRIVSFNRNGKYPMGSYILFSDFREETID